SLIGLSPLITGHRKPFQRLRVRSSSKCYLTFNLPMTRSPGFGSNPTNSIALFTRFRCAYTYRLKLARETKSLTHYTRGTPSHLAVLRLLVGIRFQILFHSPHRGAFHLSLTVLVHY